MYTVVPTHYFTKPFKKLVKKVPYLRNAIISVIKLLSDKPFDTVLKTHKVDSRLYKNVYSSRVTGDIRIIWQFGKDGEMHILLLEIGGHSGAGKVYR